MKSNNKKKRVAVGLSGGVDSSVCAALLKEEGYEVIGLFMKIFDGSIPVTPAGKHTCYGPGEEESIASAAAICEKLKIPFYVIDLNQEFKEHVIEYFRNEYLAGRTPNPCIVCNRGLKFGLLLEKAKAKGIDFSLFATGHYARIVESEGRYILKRALDRSKDQTYFLYGLNQDQLSRIMFPLGKYRKKEVKDTARSLGLESSIRPESQDFISGGDFSPFFRENEIKPGDIVNKKGDLLGKHRGIVFYTLGQRKGLGISFPRPLYVSGIDPGKNRIIVDEKEALFSKGLIAGDLNLISVDEIKKPLNVSVKIRFNHQAAEALLMPGVDNGAEVVFKEPQLSVTPGQSAVFYAGETVLGGGVIEEAKSLSSPGGLAE